MTRRILPLLLLATVFVLPADASRRRAVSTPNAGVVADALGIGHLNGASLAGTVASIDGTVITLDTAGAPAIRIEAVDAKIVAGDRLVQTIADIDPGARITVFLEKGASDSPLPARLIMVESRPDLMIAGPVDAIDLGASTFTVLGITIRVDDGTEFESSLPTFAPVDGLEDLQVGNVVKVDASLPGGSVLAERVVVMKFELRDPPATLRGTVKSIGETAWVITNRDGDTTITVNGSTKIAGDPKVGDEVQIVAERDSAGAYVALAIVKIGPVGPQDIQFRGWVNAIGETEWQIGGPVGSNAPVVTVKITGETEIYPDPKVGDLVHVRATVGIDRVVTAKKIEKAKH